MRNRHKISTNINLIHSELEREFNTQLDYVRNFSSHELANFERYMRDIVSGLQSADPKSIDKLAGLYDNYQGTPTDFIDKNDPYNVERFPTNVLSELKHDKDYPKQSDDFWKHYMQDRFLQVPSDIVYLMIDQYSDMILGNAGLEGWYDEITTRNNISTGDLYEAGNTLKDVLDAFVEIARSEVMKIEKELLETQSDFLYEYDMGREEETSKTVIGAIIEESLRVHDELDTYTPIVANKRLSRIIDVFKDMRDQIATYSDIKRSDMATFDIHLSDLDDVNSRNKSSDIRSLDDKLLRKEDAKIIFSKMHNHWRLVLKRLDTSSTRQFNGIPAYRYNVGENVRITTTNRKGRIVGARREHGTGKQLYDIKINGIDKPKTYGLSKIRRD